jgi:signal transduction histidine kinase
MLVPLKAHGRVLGLLTCVSAESGVEYDEDDVALAEELAVRCALALDNALLHAQLKQALAQKEEAVQERERLLAALELERARLEAVLQQMPAGVLMLEAGTGRVRFANARADQLLGRALMTEGFDPACGYKAWTLDGRELPTEEWPLARAAWKGEAVHGQEMQFDRGDGTRQRLLCSAIPLFDAEGRWVAAVGTFENVTAMREAEEQALRHARILEQFIGILGHDLRNPLQAISGSVQLLQRRERLEHEQRALRRIAGASARMERMITDLLDFTRSRLGGGIPLVPERVCLPELARQIAEELEVAHAGPKVALDSCPDGCGVWDRDRIAQVIQNVLSNALQYGSPDAPVRVTLRDEPDHVRLEVHNHGPAIPPEVLARLFEPFRRGSSSANRTKGLGLGLYIARQVVLAHGGTVDVRSSDGDGTTFTVRLPREPPAQGAQLTT